MGYLQTYILEYLQGAGPRTNAQIRDAVSQEYQVHSNTITVTLGRMRRGGLLERRRCGLYAVSRRGVMRSCDRMLVAGTLDRLEKEFGEALEMELARRGWTKQ